MKRRAEHLRVEPVKINARVGYLVFDLIAKCTVPELNLYSLHMERLQSLDSKTIYKRLIALTQFWEFLRRSGIVLQHLSDEDLRHFRDQELNLVRLQPAFRGDIRTAKRTVNEKLSTVFQWMAWMQGRDELRHATVTLPAPKMTRGTQPDSAHRVRRYAQRVTETVVFRDAAAGSKHHVGFVPTELTRDEVDRFFFSQASDAYTAHRNSLIVAIADLVGFRRASINSLIVAQFEKSQLEATLEPATLVRPLSQKFGYQNDFAFPVALALRVCDFIAKYRDPLVRRKGADLTVTGDRIFLSSRDARPLTDRAITQIVRTAMTAVGAPKGMSLHAFRAKYANDQIEEEIFVRRENGMDTSTASISASVALKLGHRNPTSLFAYVSAGQSLAARKDSALRKRRFDEVADELEKTKNELAAARAALTKVRSQPD